jgi:S1-C subfamily serine protease
VAEELAIPETKGVAVVNTEPGFYAQSWIRPGDIIVEVNGEQIETTQGLEKLLGKSSRGWKMTIQRGGQLISANIMR